MSDVLAILCSDIHLSHKAPVARSAEPDWYAAQRRVLDELAVLSGSAMYGPCPIICAGDVFDRWNSPAELINFAIESLPTMYAIPGQHDLPNHSLAEINRSAYWTLVKAGKIKHMDQTTRIDDTIVAVPFPWGREVVPAKVKNPGGVNLAVVHSYVWATPANCYSGAPVEQWVSNRAKQLKGYDAAVFGDNHIGFTAYIGGCHMINTGTLMRRKSDERNYRPTVGLLYEDGTIEPYHLDTSKDLWLDEREVVEREQVEFSAQGFLARLREMDADSLDYREAVERVLSTMQMTISPEAKQMVLETLEE